MGIVDYSDSDEDDKNNEAPLEDHSSPVSSDYDASLKRKRDGSTSSDLPPLPGKFLSLYSTNVRVSTEDDPSLHEGKIRIVPHVQGNWPTHVSLEWLPNDNESTILNSVVEYAQRTAGNWSGRAGNIPRITSLLKSDLGAAAPLHISLSRSLVLKTDQKDRFLAKVETCVNQSHIRSLSIKLTSLKWVPNHERTRYFLVAGCQKPTNNGLNRLLRATNRAADAFDLGKLYDRDEFGSETKGSKRAKLLQTKIGPFEELDFTDCFHVSLAWALAPIDGAIIDSTDADGLLASLATINLRFDAVQVKIGNVASNIKLKSKQLESAKTPKNIMT